MSHAFVEVQQAAKRFPGAKGGEGLTVFENVSFSLEKGEFVCIIGHSGCGKSTIMNALAGLDQFSDGAMVMEGKEINGPGLERGVVFQNYSLLPWLTALENVRFGVRARWKAWDEAILLADRIFLMTNGPQARIAEAVEIDLPRPRSRAEIVKHPHFYTIRNYLVDFLVNRSGELRTADLDRRGLHYPRPVNPVAESATESHSADAPASASPNEKLVKFTPKETHHG